MSTATFGPICFNQGYLWKDEHRISKAKSKNERVKLYVRGASVLSTQCKQSSEKNKKEVRIGLLGASGYTGAEDLPTMISVRDADFSNVDAVFCCLPHGTTQEIIKGLPQHLKIVDLSAVHI
ncbi:hypothetical protein DITRI_Ditri13aG0020000 [Diplodiscus trichospermus]